MSRAQKPGECSRLLNSRGCTVFLHHAEEIQLLDLLLLAVKGILTTRSAVFMAKCHGDKPNVPAMFSCHQADSVRSSKAGNHKRQH